MNSIEIPFALGVQIWWAYPMQYKESVPCPDCLGTRKLRVVQANGEEFELGCCACTVAYLEPCGEIRTTRTKFYPREYTPTGIDRIDVEDGATYKDWMPGSGGGSMAYAKDLRATKEECEVRCAEKTAAARIEEDKRMAYTLRCDKEKLAWSLNYWNSQRKNHVRDIEYIDARMKQIKAANDVIAFLTRPPVEPKVEERPLAQNGGEIEAARNRTYTHAASGDSQTGLPSWEDVKAERAATDSALAKKHEEIERLRRELEHFQSSGIIEVAVRNSSVSDYMKHWEGRAESAESTLRLLREELNKAATKWRTEGGLWGGDYARHFADQLSTLVQKFGGK